MEVKAIVIHLGLIYLGLLLPKVMGEDNSASPLEFFDNILTVLISSSSMAPDEKDNGLTLQSKTNIMQETEHSQNKITSRNMGLQTNGIQPKLNKPSLTLEMMKAETTNKERFFTSAISSIERSEIGKYEHSKIMTKSNNKLTSTQPFTTKATAGMPSMLQVTNATETSISLSWDAPTNITQFFINFGSILDHDNNENKHFKTNNKSATITNLTCSGCAYNISVASIYNNKKCSQAVFITNYTVPKMPNVTVKAKLDHVIIKIDIGGKDCNTLKTDNHWEINAGSVSENCQIENGELKKCVKHSLKIWRKVGVWESKKQVITFQLKKTKPLAVNNLTYICQKQDLTISWLKPIGSCVTSYLIRIHFKNPNKSYITNTSTTNSSYTIKSYKPASNYTVSVYAVNSIGTGPKAECMIQTRSETPDAVKIFVKDTTAVNVTLSLGEPNVFKGDIRGYIIEISEIDKKKKNGKSTIIYHIKFQDCWLVNSSSNSCSCLGNDHVNNTITLQSLNQSFTLTRLTPYTRYSISAKAYTDAGCGVKSNKTIKTNESAPSKVQNFMVVDKGSRWIKVNWTCPMYPNGIIQIYLIIFDNITKYINATSFQFQNLKPYHNYTIDVAAMTIMKGEISRLKVQTYSDVPDSVAIQSSNFTSKSITIKWYPPINSNGPIKNYTIYWRNVEENSTDSRTIFNRTFTIENLEPYRCYYIYVEICNDLFCKKSSQVVERTISGVPHPARNVSAEALSATSIRVQWQEPFEFTGPTSYIIKGCSLELPKTLPPLKEFNISGFNNTSIIINDLQEYWLYQFNVTTKTSAGFAATILTLQTRTQESAPGPVESLNIYVNYSSYNVLLVTWKKPLPEEENGIIIKYEITYWDDNNAKKNISFTDFVFSTKMLAIAEHNYTIQIRAATSKGFGDVRNKTVYVEPRIPIVQTDVIINKSNEEVVDSSRQIAINLPEKFFKDFTYGIPIKWGLIVAQSEAVNSNAQKDELCPNKLKRWDDVYSSEISHPYRPTRTDWKPQFILEQGKDSSYILGKEEDCEDSHLYCNGYLKSNTYYCVKAFMCTKVGCAATKYSGAMRTDKDPTPIYITVPVLLIAACVSVIIIFIMWNKKLYCFKNKKIPTISSLVDANQNGKVNHSFSLKISETTRPILLAHFHSKVEMMMRDSSLQFSEEFKLLKTLSLVQPHAAAELQANRTKNRYTNILAYDHSRVKLLPLDDEEGSDYINANYIPGFNRPREYIAAQGPLHSTKDDFWRMIWEQNVSIVVMVTLPVERGRVKCEDYWPNGNEPVYFGDLVVQLKSESNLSDYVIRIMDVNLGESTREVKQFHFLKWPDFGCPKNTSLLIDFVQTIRTHMPYLITGPTLVHCSAGVGRTGTYIVIDRLLQHLQYNNEVDIFGSVLELRKYRPNMVQTEDQYIFIYQCISDHLKQIEKSETEDIYINNTVI